MVERWILAAASSSIPPMHDSVTDSDRARPTSLCSDRGEVGLSIYPGRRCVMKRILENACLHALDFAIFGVSELRAKVWRQSHAYEEQKNTRVVPLRKPDTTFFKDRFGIPQCPPGGFVSCDGDPPTRDAA